MGTNTPKTFSQDASLRKLVWLVLPGKSTVVSLPRTDCTTILPTENARDKPGNLEGKRKMLQKQNLVDSVDRVARLDPVGFVHLQPGELGIHRPQGVLLQGVVPSH